MKLDSKLLFEIKYDINKLNSIDRKVIRKSWFTC